MSDASYFSLLGLTGTGWADDNDLFRQAITAPNSTQLVTNWDTSGYGAFESTNAYLIRTDCYEDDTSYSEWNRALASDGSGSTMNKVIGDLGINIMIRYGGYPAAWIGQNNTTDCDTYNANNNHAKGYIDALRDVDAWFMTMYNSHSPGSWPMYADWMWNLCTDGTVEGAIDLFTTGNDSNIPGMADNDGFMGFYLNDEYWLNGREPQNLANVDSRARAYRDTNTGGLSVSLDMPHAPMTTQWNQTTDVFATDPYPIWTSNLTFWDVPYNHDTAPYIGRNWSYNRVFGASVFESRPIWSILQLWRSQTTVGFPTLTHHKQAIIFSLAAGVRGIGWWELNWNGDQIHNATFISQQQANHTNWVTAIKRLITPVEDILAEPVLDLTDRADGEADYGRILASVSDSDVKCSTRELGTRVLIACGNQDEEDADNPVTLTLADTTYNGVATRLWDNSKVPITDGVLSDTFEGTHDATAPENSVHMYLIETQPKGMAIHSSR